MKATIAVYISTHGYGHCVRSGAVCAQLAERLDLRFVVRAAAPASLWPATLSGRTQWRPYEPDAGVVQAGDLQVDLKATRERVKLFLGKFDQECDKEAARLRHDNVDLVIGDVPPLAFEAAHRAGIASVGIANFTWDWIYQQMGLTSGAQQAAAAYAHATTLFGLTPDTPMPGFGHRIDVGLLGRRSRTDRHLVRRALRIKPHHRLVLLSLRAEGRDASVALPEPYPDVFYMLPGDPGSRSDIIGFAADRSYEELVAAADVVVSKPGYGIIGDAAANGTPLLWVAREDFPEDPALERWIESNLLNEKVARQELANGGWFAGLAVLLGAERRDPIAAPAAGAIAAQITALLAG